MWGIFIIGTCELWYSWLPIFALKIFIIKAKIKCKIVKHTFNFADTCIKNII